MTNEQLKKRFPKAFRIYLKWAKSNVKPMERDKYDFFDEQEIEIGILPFYDNIHNKADSFETTIGGVFVKGSKTRYEAETKAFEKAFKILENRLSNIKLKNET